MFLRFDTCDSLCPSYAMESFLRGAFWRSGGVTTAITAEDKSEQNSHRPHRHEAQEQCLTVATSPFQDLTVVLRSL